MESPTLALQSVPAEVSEFFRTELKAFVQQSRSRRPHAWACVERLQRVCLASSPATLVGLECSIQVVHESAVA